MEFNAAVLPHVAELRKRARSLTRSYADGEDLTQDTLLRAFRSWSTFTERGNGVKGWLFRTLYNQFINDYQAAKSRARWRTAAHEERCATTRYAFQQSGSLTLAECELAVMIDRSLPDEVVFALNTLSAEFREAVVAIDLADNTYAETAEAKSLPIGTVMSRLFRGRKALRVALRPYAESVGAV